MNKLLLLTDDSIMWILFCMIGTDDDDCDNEMEADDEC